MGDDDCQPWVLPRNPQERRVPARSVVVDLDRLPVGRKDTEQVPDGGRCRRLGLLAADLDPDDARRVSPAPDVVAGGLPVIRVRDEVAQHPGIGGTRRDDLAIAGLAVGFDGQHVRADRIPRPGLAPQLCHVCLVGEFGNVLFERSLVGMRVDRARRTPDLREVGGPGAQAQESCRVDAEDRTLVVVADAREPDGVDRRPDGPDRAVRSQQDPVRTDGADCRFDAGQVRHRAGFDEEVRVAAGGRERVHHVDVMRPDEDDRNAQFRGGTPDRRRIVEAAKRDEQGPAGLGGRLRQLHCCQAAACRTCRAVQPEPGDPRSQGGGVAWALAALWRNDGDGQQACHRLAFLDQPGIPGPRDPVGGCPAAHQRDRDSVAAALGKKPVHGRAGGASHRRAELGVDVDVAASRPVCSAGRRDRRGISWV